MRTRQFLDFNEELNTIIKESTSRREVFRKLNKSNPNSGTWYRELASYVSRHSIDISHFTGQLWSKGKKLGPSKNRVPNEEIFVNNGKNRGHIKGRFLELSSTEYKCSICGIDSWNGKKISLQMDHINGISYDNRLENLRLVCPNCHSQTETFCRAKKNKCERGDLNSQPTGSKPASSANWDTFAEETKHKKPKLEKPKTECLFCKKLHGSKGKYCSAKCYQNSCKGSVRLNRRKVERPSREILQEEVNRMSFLALGRKYGVSDNAVRKWCGLYGIPIK